MRSMPMRNVTSPLALACMVPMHGGDIILHLCALPIGKLSEEASEARNKDFKKYTENY